MVKCTASGFWQSILLSSSVDASGACGAGDPFQKEDPGEDIQASGCLFRGFVSHGLFLQNVLRAGSGHSRFQTLGRLYMEEHRNNSYSHKKSFMMHWGG